VSATPGIGFTIPPDLRDLLDRVRAGVEEDEVAQGQSTHQATGDLQ
jgi:hypothetical protein